MLGDRQVRDRYARQPEGPVMKGLICPDWCAKDHQCTVIQGSPAGVHRSDPMRWSTSYGSLVVVRNQDLSGADWLELHVHARLGRTELATQEQASQLAIQVDSTIRDVVLPVRVRRPGITARGQHVRT